jgi:steroid delta-isomerase-like uncharacterized protein
MLKYSSFHRLERKHEERRVKDTEALIRSYYERFNQKDWQGMLGMLSEDVAHDSNQGGRSHGRDAFQRFLADMDKHYDERLVDIVVMVDPSGKRAAAELVCNGVYKTSAPGLPPARMQKYSLPVGAFFDVQSGKIARVTTYYNLKEWIRQVS